jgi:hypothetical protein
MALKRKFHFDLILPICITGSASYFKGLSPIAINKRTAMNSNDGLRHGEILNWNMLRTLIHGAKDKFFL